jgi:hypothetical protein
MRDHYQDLEAIFAKAIHDRHQWQKATQHSRHLAIAADAELRRRHPGQQIEPLKSAEPETISEAQREDMVLSPGQGIGETAEWVKDLTAKHRKFLERLEERQALTVLSEAPDREGLGHPVPSRSAPGREAILQPPKPMIRPSAKILELARGPDAAREAID